MLERTKVRHCDDEIMLQWFSPRSPTVDASAVPTSAPIPWAHKTGCRLYSRLAGPRMTPASGISETNGLGQSQSAIAGETRRRPAGRPRPSLTHSDPQTSNSGCAGAGRRPSVFRPSDSRFQDERPDLSSSAPEWLPHASWGPDDWLTGSPLTLSRISNARCRLGPGAAPSGQCAQG
jgi:hypothetical protein